MLRSLRGKKPSQTLPYLSVIQYWPGSRNRLETRANHCMRDGTLGIARVDAALWHRLPACILLARKRSLRDQSAMSSSILKACYFQGLDCWYILRICCDASSVNVDKAFLTNSASSCSRLKDCSKSA